MQKICEESYHKEKTVGRSSYIYHGIPTLVRQHIETVPMYYSIRMNCDHPTPKTILNITLLRFKNRPPSGILGVINDIAAFGQALVTALHRKDKSITILRVYLR